MNRDSLRPGAGFVEVGDRVWVARSAWFDVNVAVVEGDRGLLVVDTHASEDAMREVLADLRRVSGKPVLTVVATHAHVDHVLGTAAVRDESPDLRVIAHEDADIFAAATAAQEAARTSDDPRDAGLVRSRIVPADETFASVKALDLGDRYVELIHPGRGHTAGDLVVRVPDTDVLLAGDLVEESGPPAYGEDCFPLEWPGALDVLAEMLTDRTVVVPGHGDPVGRAFVQEQRGDVGVVAETIFDLASRSVPLGDALAQQDWPFPAEALQHAVRRGYAQVPRTQRRLPLV